MIETTINIKKSYTQELTAICGKFNLSRSKLIALLIEKFIQEKRMVHASFKRVAYQERQKKKCWKIMHICFSAVLFEKCCDVRKCAKISVSRFIAMAIDAYLDIIEKELSEGLHENNTTDNYQGNYLCIYNDDAKISNFHIYWGIPNRKEVKRSLES
jgi:hypothetical protein